ncbi:MAG: triose-phosphate isomerase [Chloroflexi bacterium]|nr:MAG: triose-phosphate isomerase [Chloroflexota bacterium]
MERKPLVLANWKMAMGISETISFIERFIPLVGKLAEEVDIIICPPYTSLYVAACKLKGSSLQLGAQNLHPGPGLAFTGEISASLLADVGCRWVMLGHWERRRYFGETDELVNRKVRAALDAGLHPVLLVGESREARESPYDDLARQLECILSGCNAQEIKQMAFVYEPEWAIGVEKPASGIHIQKGCAYIREWLNRRFGGVGNSIRIIYGGSVSPESAPNILTQPDVDGLGTTRKGRDPFSLFSIVKAVAEARVLT